MFMAFGVTAALGVLWNANLPFDRTEAPAPADAHLPRFHYEDDVLQPGAEDETKDYYKDVYDKREDAATGYSFEGVDGDT
jgi:hypothetical protein